MRNRITTDRLYRSRFLVVMTANTTLEKRVLPSTTTNEMSSSTLTIEAVCLYETLLLLGPSAI